MELSHILKKCLILTKIKKYVQPAKISGITVHLSLKMFGYKKVMPHTMEFTITLKYKYHKKKYFTIICFNNHF